MSRKRSKSGNILEFFRTGDAGEAKVLYQLIGDTMRERFSKPAPKQIPVSASRRAPAPKAKAATAGSAAGVAGPQSTQEVA